MNAPKLSHVLLEHLGHIVSCLEIGKESPAFKLYVLNFYDAVADRLLEIYAFCWIGEKAPPKMWEQVQSGELDPFVDEAMVKYLHLIHSTLELLEDLSASLDRTDTDEVAIDDDDEGLEGFLPGKTYYSYEPWSPPDGSITCAVRLQAASKEIEPPAVRFLHEQMKKKTKKQRESSGRIFHTDDVIQAFLAAKGDPQVFYEEAKGISSQLTRTPDKVWRNLRDRKKKGLNLADGTIQK